LPPRPTAGLSERCCPTSLPRSRKPTLDALIAQAEPHPDWHGPLVRRPVLTRHAILALSGFVATQLVDILAQRADLDPAIAAELLRRVSERLQPEATPTAPGLADDELLTCIRRLDAMGSLNEATLIEAARAGDERRVAAVLAVASGLPLAAVDRAISLRSAKGLISLTWKAGLSMRAAVIVQAILGQLGPGAVMLAASGGAFPLTIDEMRWQLEVLDQSRR